MQCAAQLEAGGSAVRRWAFYSAPPKLFFCFVPVVNNVGLTTEPLPAGGVYRGRPLWTFPQLRDASHWLRIHRDGTTVDDLDYWIIVKNSYGEGWGEE